MKTMILTLLAVLVLAGTTSAQNKKQNLTIRITDVRPDGANIMLCVGNYKQAPQDMKGAIVKADSTTVSCVIEGIDEGVFNIYGYHDDNGNKK